jgi:hypothetical protein
MVAIARPHHGRSVAIELRARLLAGIQKPKLAAITGASGTDGGAEVRRTDIRNQSRPSAELPYSPRKQQNLVRSRPNLTVTIRVGIVG